MPRHLRAKDLLPQNTLILEFFGFITLKAEVNPHFKAASLF